MFCRFSNLTSLLLFFCMVLAQYRSHITLAYDIIWSSFYTYLSHPLMTSKFSLWDSLLVVLSSTSQLVYRAIRDLNFARIDDSKKLL